MRAINNYLVVDKIKEGPKTIAGLIITENIDDENRYARARVISVGDQVTGLEEGEIIQYDKFAGHAITWEENVYMVIKSGDVILVE
tara:strand:+ start:1008 stop:1265 length:258 start_codon:yes stop_codon:yes gene_type:complete